MGLIGERRGMNKMEKRALWADGALLFVAVIWGGGFVCAKIALTDVTPFYVLGLRVFGAGVILAGVFWRKLVHIDRKSLINGMLLGLLLSIGQGMQMVGLQYTTPGKQAFLVASYTLLIPFVSWFILKRRPPMVAIGAGFLTLMGVGFLSIRADFTIGFGDCLSLASAVFFAFHITLIGIFAHKGDPIRQTVIQLLTGGAISLVLAFIFEPPLGPIGRDSALAIGYLMLINTAIAFTIQNVAQGYTTATHSSVIMSLESVFGLGISVWLLGEAFTPKMMVGCGIIFCAVLMSKFDKDVDRPREKPGDDERTEPLAEKVFPAQ